MKKIILLTTVVVFAAMLQNCEDFLEKAPLDTISTDCELNETDAVALINAAYQPLQWPKLYNMRIWSTDIVAGNSYVGADGASDGVETTDLANFTASLLMRGSQKRTFEQIYDELESVGADLGFSSGNHTTDFSASCHY